MISSEKDNAEVKQEVTKDKAEENIVIDIKGAVKHPGVYEMHAGDRVSQAIEKAGGIGEKADETQVNLAELLQDGTVVYIPSEGEEEPPQAAGGAVQSKDGERGLGQYQYSNIRGFTKHFRSRAFKSRSDYCISGRERAFPGN